MGAGIELRDAAPLGILFTVEAQPALGVDALGIAPQPEVHQVKMVSRFMHQQAAAVALLPVPAAEVVRAVFGVEQPLKMDGVDLANRTVHQQLAYLAVVRRVAVVKGYTHAAARLFDSVKDTQGALLINGHRLFSNDVAPGP